MLGTAFSSITSNEGIPGRILDSKIRRGDLLDIELDHHLFGDLPAFAGTVLQALKPVLHFGDTAFEPIRQRFIGKRGTEPSSGNAGYWRLAALCWPRGRPKRTNKLFIAIDVVVSVSSAGASEVVRLSECSHKPLANLQGAGRRDPTPR